MQFFSPWAPLWLPAQRPGNWAAEPPTCALCKPGTEPLQGGGRPSSAEQNHHSMEPPALINTLCLLGLMINYLRTKNCFTSGALSKWGVQERFVKWAYNLISFYFFLNLSSSSHSFCSHWHGKAQESVDTSLTLRSPWKCQCCSKIPKFFFHSYFPGHFGVC